MSGIPELQPGESGVAYFLRLSQHFKSPWDPTGVVALTQAASVAALALADRNEPVQRAMLEELKTLNETLAEMAVQQVETHKLFEELAKRFPVI